MAVWVGHSVFRDTESGCVGGLRAVPTSYGGSKWQRNVPLPDEVGICLDYGRDYVVQK